MPPDDPLGRHGPSLDNFLRKKPIVPEHKKQPCPYGNCPYEYFPCTLRVQYTIKLGLISINTESLRWILCASFDYIKFKEVC